MEFVCRGCEDGVAEQLLRQGAHGVRPFPNYGKVACGSLSLRLLLQQVEIAADGSQRRAQVMRDIGDGDRQRVVPGLQPQTLPAERLQLPVDVGDEGLHGPVAAGDGDQRIRVGPQLFVQLLRSLAQRMAQHEQIRQQTQRGERKRTDQNDAPKLHKNLLLSFRRHRMTGVRFKFSYYILLMVS